MSDRHRSQSGDRPGMQGMTAQDDQTTNATSDTAGVIDAVRELITMMSKGGINELDVTTGDVSIRLRSSGTDAAAPVASPVAIPETASPTEAPEDEGHIVT